MMFERSEGVLVFSRDNTPWAVGFDLHWDDETIQAAYAGEIPLLDVSGWFRIEYDVKASELDVQWAEPNGQVFNVSYLLNAGEEVEAREFLTYVDEFFQFMRGQLQFGGVAAGNCEGGSCSASSGDRTCSVCCPAGFYADSSASSSGARCKCIRLNPA